MMTRKMKKIMYGSAIANKYNLISAVYNAKSNDLELLICAMKVYLRGTKGDTTTQKRTKSNPRLILNLHVYGGFSVLGARGLSSRRDAVGATHINAVGIRAGRRQYGGWHKPY